MKNKTLLILVLLLVVCIVMIKKAQVRKTASLPPSETTSTNLLLSFDVNAVTHFTITAREQTTTVNRKEEKWVVSSLYDYPADFSKVANSLAELADLTGGQIIRGGTDYLADFGLEESNVTGSLSRTMSVALFGSDDKALGQLTIGNPRMSQQEQPWGGYPNGQYVRADNGPVMLITKTLRSLSARNMDWLRKDLVAVPPEEVVEVEVHTSNSVYHLTVKGPGEYQIGSLKEDEEINKDTARSVVNALQNVMIAGVAVPEKKVEEWRLGEAGTYRLKTKDGLIYTCQLGRKSVEESGTYARFTVSYEKPIPPPVPVAATNEVAESSIFSNAVAAADVLKQFEEKASQTARKAVDENTRFSGWVYILPDYLVNPMTMDRTKIVQVKKSQPETIPTETDQPDEWTPPPLPETAPSEH